jgi:hypothetical protein
LEVFVMSKKTDLIAYCGLYCATCPALTGSIANLAKDLRKELKRSKCDKAASGLAKIPTFAAFKHYDKFDELLVALTQMQCKKPCRAGGGSPNCQIRKCVVDKGLTGCWQCGDFTKCATLKTLEEFGDVDKTYLKNLRKIKRQGTAAFVKAQGS